jgi:hypothetical protein
MGPIPDVQSESSATEETCRVIAVCCLSRGGIGDSYANRSGINDPFLKFRVNKQKTEECKQQTLDNREWRVEKVGAGKGRGGRWEEGGGREEGGGQPTLSCAKFASLSACMCVYNTLCVCVCVCVCVRVCLWMLRGTYRRACDALHVRQLRLLTAPTPSSFRIRIVT